MSPQRGFTTKECSPESRRGVRYASWWWSQAAIGDTVQKSARISSKLFLSKSVQLSSLMLASCWFIHNVIIDVHHTFSSNCSTQGWDDVLQRIVQELLGVQYLLTWSVSANSLVSVGFYTRIMYLINQINERALEPMLICKGYTYQFEMHRHKKWPGFVKPLHLKLQLKC